MVSMLHVELLFGNLDRISSIKYNKTPTSFEFLSSIYPVQNPFDLNLAEENESSNLFLIELIFKLTAIIFSGHWIFIYLSPIFASRVSLRPVLYNEFGIIFL